ncbi:PadR family transcriptional regulator [Lentzea tibetensis]|uniref:PadR family transcriptional regulator n=1 Tax=Lentzea tibetensis TaxID=2591470 RepID=A0A563EQD2_9PSEU|nr:PadR family transcriptional regulator [Lentzea tibetensis]TWP49606.1 PadR family transcriptional regulator [Lentzea tibetensis]
MKYRRTNPLALAVLALLWERPMHPYELAATMRERHQENVIKLNYGSLYTVVDGLAKAELIRHVEFSREGKRPERSVYALTPEGRAELDSWLRELIAVPAREYPQFEAGISMVGLLPPDEAQLLLTRRAAAVEEHITALTTLTAQLKERGLPRLAWIELDYRMTMLRAEHAWLTSFTEATRDGTVDGHQFWVEAHR